MTSGGEMGGRRGERLDPGPERTYRERLEHWRSEARSAERRSDRIGDLRLAVTLAFAVERLGARLARLLVEDDRVRAVHFEERIEAGRLVFDHRLRAGVASAGNALQLMRDLGFRIDSPAALQERSDR